MHNGCSSADTAPT